MSRKLIASNNNETILMPRHAYVVNNELYVPSWRVRMIGRTVKICKDYCKISSVIRNPGM